jgi:hypothetical protein
MTYPSVLSAFQKWTEDNEGRLPYMYLDVLGKVTTGIGNLIDSVFAAQALPWKHGASGSLATPSEVATGWAAVKALQDQKEASGRYTAFQNATDLRLSQSDVDNLFQSVLSDFTSKLKVGFPNFDSLPADAQMALLGMSWALGPNFAPGWPKFTAAVNASPPDFLVASTESRIINGTVKRNAAQAFMLLNANSVSKNGLDPSVLHYPAAATALEGAALGAATSAIFGEGFLLTAGLGVLLGIGVKRTVESIFKPRSRGR